jgi:hypothetical protein
MSDSFDLRRFVAGLSGAVFCRETRGQGHHAGLAHRRSRAITVAGPSYGLPDRLDGRCKHRVATMATEELRRLKGPRPSSPQNTLLWRHRREPRSNLEYL